MDGVANNISLSGMFITCNSLFVKPDSVVQVKCLLKVNGHLNEHCVDVLVVKVLTDGMMVGFHNFDSNMFCCIRDIILRRKSDRVKEHRNK